MKPIEQRIFDIVSALSADSVIEDFLFYQLSADLLQHGSGVNDKAARSLAWRQSIDFYLPDESQMLYLVLIPRCPALFGPRLEGKPYDYGIKIVDGSYRIDFNTVFRVLAESSIENQPLTIIANQTTLSLLTTRLDGCTYDLPDRSRIVCHTKTPTVSNLSSSVKSIFGYCDLSNFYCPPGIVSYGVGIDRFMFPPWVRPMIEENGSLSFTDLLSFSCHGRVTLSTNVGRVDGQYVLP